MTKSKKVTQLTFDEMKILRNAQQSSNTEKNELQVAHEQNKEPIIFFQPQKVLVFDLKGPNAHFRNIQTNSTSLSYYFPPPTTLYGLIAGIIGFQYDTYYEEFNPSKLFLGLEVLVKPRKNIFTVNYPTYKEEKITQIPLELLFPADNAELCYRVYFSIDSDVIYKQIFSVLQNRKFVFPPFLGLTEMIGRIDFVGEFEIIQVPEGVEAQLNNVFPAKSYELKQSTDQIIKLFPEYMRYFFLKNRVPSEMKRYFYCQEGEFRVIVQKDDFIYSINMNSEQKIICRL